VHGLTRSQSRGRKQPPAPSAESEAYTGAECLLLVSNLVARRTTIAQYACEYMRCIIPHSTSKSFGSSCTMHSESIQIYCIDKLMTTWRASMKVCDKLSTSNLSKCFPMFDVSAFGGLVPRLVPQQCDSAKYRRSDSTASFLVSTKRAEMESSESRQTSTSLVGRKPDTA
jgi:hypothetical protein